jgi:hypothetical protein
LNRFAVVPIQCARDKNGPIVRTFFLETDEDFVYFDARDNLAASPVQTYVELMRGDKRERETAAQVREAILPSPDAKG